MKKTQQILNQIAILIFATAVAGIGFTHLLSGHFPIGLLPVPKPIYTSIFCYLNGIIMITTSLLLCLKKTQKFALTALSILLLILAIMISIPDLIYHFFNANNWTGTFELISICGISLIIYGLTIKKEIIYQIGKYFLASGLVVFAILHYRYAKFIIYLMPAWVPGKGGLNWLIIFIFCCSAISLMSSKFIKFTIPILGGMFLTWVLILHLPRVSSKPLIEAEWTSMFIALAIGSIAFLSFESPKPIRKS